MNELAIANIEYIESQPFLVVILYGKDGYFIDNIIVPYENTKIAIRWLKALRNRHGIKSLNVWTSNQELYGAMLETVGIAGEIKHTDNTSETKRMIDEYKKLLAELHEIKPTKPIPKLPKWRYRLFIMLTKLTNLIGGNGKYDIEI
ncbi:hypothetical protein [Calidifontibacillus erzurumensis]|uniref:Uncharacterized protein n=1 Tax=Calidifontibacillus erzurumensis TaxID=2741433 RepID=A0A8J8GH63_9BACI|nr:hypothetical protein [Calidifontibacillus erzurumensis]NSL51706.1 hypothetical protein [Calidifontibacillus erzurumensis]